MKQYLNKFCSLIGFLSLMLVLPAQANAHHRGSHHHHHHHRHWHPNYGWVAPMVVGGVVTYVLTRPQPVVVQEPSVIVERDTRTVCSNWKEFQTAEGRIYRERTCQAVQE